MSGLEESEMNRNATLHINHNLAWEAKSLFPVCLHYASTQFFVVAAVKYYVSTEHL